MMLNFHLIIGLFINILDHAAILVPFHIQFFSSTSLLGFVLYFKSEEDAISG